MNIKVWVMLLICLVMLSGCDKRSIKDEITVWELPLVSELEPGQIVHVLNNNGMASGSQYLVGISDIVINTKAYENEQIRRGDVVFFKTNSNDEFYQYDISRVVGLPGETIKIRRGQIYIDNRKLKAFYGSAFFADKTLRAKDAFTMDEEVLVPDGHYFLTGDLWWRSFTLGVISQNQLRGRLWGGWRCRSRPFPNRP